MTYFAKELIFRVIRRYNSLIEKYRADYFLFIYKDKIQGGQGLQMGKSSSVSIISSNDNSFIKLGKNILFRRFCTITLDYSGSLEMGDDNFFNNNCSINCLKRVVIGKNNLFGENVKIYDHNHIYSDASISIREQGFSTSDIIIGNDCWFGSNCTILSNVVIGDNVIVGANNLIYKSIPANTIVKAVSQCVKMPRK